MLQSRLRSIQFLDGHSVMQRIVAFGRSRRVRQSPLVLHAWRALGLVGHLLVYRPSTVFDLHPPSPRDQSSLPVGAGNLTDRLIIQSNEQTRSEITRVKNMRTAPGRQYLEQ